MHRWGSGEGTGRGLVLMVLMMAATQLVYSHKLWTGHEPFIYKSLASRNPHLFPLVLLSAQPSSSDEKTMLLGMCKEDPKVVVTRSPVASPLSNITQQGTTASPQNNLHNTLENMVDVMEMEETDKKSKDEMLGSLKKMVDSVDSTMKLQTRTASPQTSNQTLIRLQESVLELLAVSGIEALLPLDCGKHPRSPDELLPGRGVYPWVAALGSHEDGRFHYRCIGVLITRYHILTDADCVASPNINVVLMNATDAPGPGAIVNYVAGRRIHPNIKDKEDLLSGNNIGILELALPYEFSDYVQPACLAGVFEDPDPEETSQVAIAGYEITDSPSGRMAGLFYWRKSKSLGSTTCYLALKILKEENPEIKTNLEDILTKKHLCVDRSFELVGKSVIFRVNENTGRVRLVGLGGVANAAKTNPIAYTLIQPHRFWIEVVLKKFKDNTASQRPRTSPSPPDTEP